MNSEPVRCEKESSNHKDRLYEFDRNETSDGAVILGIDEAGRGPLAGPVVAAAVVLDLTVPIEGVNDSKKLPALKRDRLFDLITGSALGLGVGIASSVEIDSVNILQATFLAMSRAVGNCSAQWDRALVDGNRIVPQFSPDRQKAVVGGDARSASIAAASIVAKVTRDRIMKDVHLLYPEYRFDIHKGYGTDFHRKLIKKLGLCPVHRRSFCAELVLQTTLDL